MPGGKPAAPSAVRLGDSMAYSMGQVTVSRSKSIVILTPHKTYLQLTLNSLVAVLKQR